MITMSGDDKDCNSNQADLKSGNSAGDHFLINKKNLSESNMFQPEGGMGIHKKRVISPYLDLFPSQRIPCGQVKKECNQQERRDYNRSKYQTVSETEAESEEVTGVHYCQNCGLWSIRRMEQPCPNCQTPGNSTIPIGTGVFSSTVGSFGGKPVKIFLTSDIPFNLKPIRRSPIDILKKKVSMIKDKRGSHHKDEEQDIPPEFDHMMTWAKHFAPALAQHEASPSHGKHEAPSALSKRDFQPSSNLSWKTRGDISGTTSRKTMDNCGGSSSSSSNCVRSAKQKSAALVSPSPSQPGEKSATIKRINDEILKKLDILDEISLLKSELEKKEFIADECNKKVKTFCKMKAMEYRLNMLNREYAKNSSAKTTSPEMKNQLDILIKEQHTNQQELARLKQDVELIKSKSYQTGDKQREENLLYKLLPRLKKVEDEEGGRFGFREFGEERTCPLEFSQHPRQVIPQSRERMRIPVNFSQRNLGGPMLSKMFRDSTRSVNDDNSFVKKQQIRKDFVLPVPGVSQGPCMKFNNLFDLSGQLKVFSEGENGSRFVIGRLLTGNTAERKFAAEELDLPNSFRHVIENPNSARVVRTLIEVDTRVRREVFTHISNNIATLLKMDHFQQFLKANFETKDIRILKEKIVEIQGTRKGRKDYLSGRNEGIYQLLTQLYLGK